VREIEGKIQHTNNYKFAIIVSKFNEFIGIRLLNGALECLKRYEFKDENIDIIKVPGAFEIPIIAEKLAMTKKYDAIIALGAVIRGETPHFDYISESVSSGVLNVSLKYAVPVTFGVLTTNTIEQALERSDSQKNNKGFDAALTAIEMANLITKL
jgi:6,7-dimethyl-8-ribityllumazine synthase